MDEPFAFVTVWPSHVEWRDHTGATGSTPVAGNTYEAVGKVVVLLDGKGINNLQFRFENWED